MYSLPVQMMIGKVRPMTGWELTPDHPADQGGATGRVVEAAWVVVALPVVLTGGPLVVPTDDGTSGAPDIELGAQEAKIRVDTNMTAAGRVTV
ncbi:MAG TPA: hypothetical protein DCY40_03885 [Actinobacteria bacterium]|nr:hypothetical protein [Actinomycetota bacterium]